MSTSDESGNYIRWRYASPMRFIRHSDHREPMITVNHEFVCLGLQRTHTVEAASSAPRLSRLCPVPESQSRHQPSPDYVFQAQHTDDKVVAEEIFPSQCRDASPIASFTVTMILEEDMVKEDEDEPSEEDEDDDVDMEADGDEEEEEHPAPADSVVVALPATDQAPSAEETKPFETDESAATPPPHLAYHVTARISIPAPVPTTIMDLM
ncbi:hypothetical protein Tco_0179419 [Tanacetum coccineum]